MPGKQSPVKIVVDVQENRSGIARLLEELGAEIEVVRLPAGDYGVGAETLVERKRVLDLHASVIKGHLWPQLGKLRAACAYSYLLVEGTHLDRGPLAPNAIRGVCLADRQRHRADPDRPPARLGTLAPPPRRPLPANGSGARPTAYAQRPRPAAGREAAEAVLASVPGISTTSARALLRHFGSVAGVLAAGPEQWRQVPGIGPERATALEATLKLRFPN